jgi:cell division protein FtsL
VHNTQVRDVYERTEDNKKIRTKAEKTFSAQEKLLYFVKVDGNGI